MKFSRFREFLEREYRNSSWKQPDIKSTVIKNCKEMPRYPVRAHLLPYLIIFVVVCLVTSLLFVNPLAKINDPRLNTQYDNWPLTSLSSDHGSHQLWLGSEGGGIKVYDPNLHIFKKDITKISSDNHLLSDYIEDLDSGVQKSNLTAIVARDGVNGGGGLQVAETSYPPTFWDKPCIDLSKFPGLSDKTASCIIASSDNKKLVLGTHGLGLGIYDIPGHSWTDIVTVDEGLPSNNINDLATIPSRDTFSIIWVATEKGICAGTLNNRGYYKSQWTYNLDSGIAGNSIRRIVIKGDYVWYLTEGKGVGRIAINSRGEPTDDNAHELLVSERRLLGLKDGDLFLAKGSHVEPTTWFLSNIDQEKYIGRYREKPHDTYGIKLPKDFDSSTITSMSVDQETGQSTIFGTNNGTWFYHDISKMNNRSPFNNILPALKSKVSYNSQSEIVGGFAGPKGVVVNEAVVCGDFACAKIINPEKPSSLIKSATSGVLPWKWSSVVGNGRFSGLNSIDDMTSVAGIGNKVFFGTKGNGIGVWDRSKMEIRQEMHSSNKEAVVRLRHDTSIDLAAMSNTLIQVTGDKAVDTIKDAERISLVPPDEAPITPSEVNTATAKGNLFVCAGSGRIGVYDMNTFGWSEIPNIAGISRLEATKGMLWALDDSGTLYKIPFPRNKQGWTVVAKNVHDLTKTSELIYVLIKEFNKPAEVRSYNVYNGTLNNIFAPGSLGSRETNWEFAVTIDDDLIFAGTDNALHRYNYKSRKWQIFPFPQNVIFPIRSVMQSENFLWMVDSRKTLHQFNPRKGVFQEGLETHVEKITSAGSAILVLCNQKDKGSQLLLYADNGNQRRTVVGRSFEGNLSQLIDAVEMDGKLVAAEGNQVGFYDWSTHDWETVKIVYGNIKKLYVVDNNLWALSVSSNGAILQAWVENHFKPVMFEGKDIEINRVAINKNGLFILSSQGKVLFVKPSSPRMAKELLAASKLKDGSSGQPSQVALIKDNIVVYRNRKLHMYGPNSGVTKWMTSSVQQPIKQMINDPSRARIVAHSDSKAWRFRQGGYGTLRGKELTPDLEDISVTGIAAGKNESICAFQVADEKGYRIRSLPVNSQEVKNVLGAPLLPSEESRSIIEDPQSGYLIRLDLAGRVSVYNPENHSWSVETKEGFLDSIWLQGNDVMGYSQNEKSIFSRRNGRWHVDPEYQGIIDKISVFKEGIVIALTKGGLVWWTHNSSKIVVRPIQNKEVLPGNFGKIVGAAESNGLFAILGGNGRLIVYDWTQQIWRSFKGGHVHSLVRKGKDIYILVDINGKDQLVGPLRRSGMHSVGAERVSHSSSIKKIISYRDKLFCLSEDHVIYQLFRRKLIKLWGGVSARENWLSNITIVAAEIIDNDLYLIINQIDKLPIIMNVNLITLESEWRPLPSGLEVNTIGVKENDSITMPYSKLNNDLLPSIFYEHRSIIITRSPKGAWRDGSGNAFDILIGSENSRRTINPTINSLARSYKIVNDIAFDDKSLLAATDGGVIGLKTDSDNSSVSIKYIYPSIGNKKTRTKVKTIEKFSLLTCRTEKGDWYEFKDGYWLSSKKIDIKYQEHARFLFVNKNYLDNWKLPEIKGEANSIKRRFKEHKWRTFKLQKTGFNFEHISVSEILNGDLYMYTPAGTIAFNKNSESIIPDDIFPKWNVSKNVSRGDIIHGPGNEIFLISKNNNLDRQVWIRGEAKWRLTNEHERIILDDIIKTPFLENEEWKWEKADSDSPVERVTWNPPGGPIIKSNFMPQQGRFGWDVCLSLGQAKGEVWILTQAGLFRINGNQIDNSSFYELEQRVSKLSFLDVCGDLPGALIDKDQTVLFYHDGWKQPKYASKDDIIALSKFRAVGEVWKLERDGVILHSLPQSPNTFKKVRIMSDGCWDFESVNDIAALNGVCYLATEAGLAEINNNTLGITGLWTDMGKAIKVDIINKKPTAKLADNKVVEHNQNDWIDSHYRGEFHSRDGIREGKRFRIIQKSKVLRFDVKRSGNVPFQPVRIINSRFAFEGIHDAHIREGQLAVLYTEEGLLEIVSSGDVLPVGIGGETVTEKLAFFKMPARIGKSILFARLGNEKYLEYQNGWRYISESKGSEMQKLSRTVMAINERWNITKENGNEMKIQLHLDDDPKNFYKTVNFNKDLGVFGFDDFTSIASPDVDSRLILGTSAGLQRVNRDFSLHRLWNKKEHNGRIIDGIGPAFVKRVVRDAMDIVQIVIEDQYYKLGKDSDIVLPSSKEKFDNAVALKASDRNGWQVEINKKRNVPLNIKWREEPVFLIKGNSGKARFAHNVVYAATALKEQLVLGTAGGLVLLDSVSEKNRASMKIYAKPFIQGSSSMPIIFGWLGRGHNNSTISAQSLLGKDKLWKIDLKNINNASQIPFLQNDSSNAMTVYKDDVFIWHHPQKDNVDIRFIPGASFPDNLVPRMANGTFAFLDIDIPQTVDQSSTLIHTSNGLFWVVKDGIVQYDLKKNLFVKLHNKEVNNMQSLEEIDEIKWSISHKVLVARSDDDIFKFDESKKKWKRFIVSPNPFLNKNLVNNSSMLEWYQTGDSIKIKSKNSDYKNLDFFVNGKPPIDEVNDFTFTTEGNGDEVLLATNAGVVSYASQGFDYLRVHTKPFVIKDQLVQRVNEIAAVRTDSVNLRKCARTDKRQSFEYIDGKWQQHKDVDEVFELSYRMVFQPGIWSWSRYPDGLTCTLLNVNGDTLRLGSRRVDSDLMSIFSKGKMVIDNVRGVAMTPNELLIATPVGVVRHDLHKEQQKSRYTGLDAWVDSPNQSKSEQMNNLQGILYDNSKIMVWNRDQVFLNDTHGKRKWKALSFKPEILKSIRWRNDGSDLWSVEPSTDKEGLLVSYASGGKGSRWFMPTKEQDIVDIGLSGGGFWVLSVNKLLHLDKARVKRNLRNWLGSSISLQKVLEGTGLETLSEISIQPDTTILHETEVQPYTAIPHEINVQPDSSAPTEPLKAEDDFARIRLITKPRGANVEIDGKDYGLTPIENVQLVVGPHILKIRLNDEIIINENVEVKGDDKEYSFDLFDNLITTGKWSILVNIGDVAVDALISYFKDKKLRGKLAETLGEIGNNKAVVPICNLLKDTSPDIRKIAIDALGKIGDLNAIAPLRYIAKADTDKEIQTKAIDVLKALNDTEFLDYNHIMQIIMEANDVCGLRQIEKEKVNKYINDYQDNEYISELKNQWDKKHNELEGGVKIKFEALLHKINTVKKINTIRELSEQFSKENTCSDLLVNLEKHAKLRIDAIKKLISSDYELLAKEINDVSNIDQLRSIQKKIDKFIKDYPDNQHISNLESVLKQKKSLLQVILRSSYSKLSVKEVRKMLNITIKEKKPNGFVGYSTIQHYYAVKMISGDQVALDHVTGLMWHMFGSDERMSHKKAEKWVQDLNNRGYAGYNDWRLPTVEEAASLLEFEKNNEDLFLGLRLGRFQPNIWTGDRHTYGGVWHVNFLKCTVGWITPYQKIYVCPVRVCK